MEKSIIAIIIQFPENIYLFTMLFMGMAGLAKILLGKDQ